MMMVSTIYGILKAHALDVWYEKTELFINFQLQMVQGYYNAYLVGVDSTHCTGCPLIGRQLRTI